MPQPIIKVNAGFMGPGQTAKSYVGVLETSTTVAVTQALETVTAKAVKELGTITAKFTHNSATVTEVPAAAYVLLKEGFVEFGSGGGIELGTTLLRQSAEAHLTQVDESERVPPATAGVAPNLGGSWARQIAKGELTLSTPYTGTTENRTVKVYSLKSTGKTFYITDVFISTSGKESTNGIVEVRLQAEGVDIFRGSLHSVAPIDLSGIETQMSATEGKQVNLVVEKCTEKVKVFFNVFGFEQ